MDKTIGWDLYRSLLAVLEEGSLSGAARALGLTRAQLAYRLRTAGPQEDS